MICPIYRQFFDPLAYGGGEDALVRGYLLPNETFFRPYVAFVTQGGMGWEGFARTLGER